VHSKVVIKSIVQDKPAAQSFTIKDYVLSVIVHAGLPDDWLHGEFVHTYIIANVIIALLLQLTRITSIGEKDLHTIIS
jgi:hypothetical protein